MSERDWRFSVMQDEGLTDLAVAQAGSRIGSCAGEGATHHTGCACWEDQRNKRIEELEAEVARLKAQLQKLAER